MALKETEGSVSPACLGSRDWCFAAVDSLQILPVRFYQSPGICLRAFLCAGQPLLLLALINPWMLPAQGEPAWSDGKVSLLLRGALAVGCGLWTGMRDGSRGWKEGGLHPNVCRGWPRVCLGFPFISLGGSCFELMFFDLAEVQKLVMLFNSHLLFLPQLQASFNTLFKNMFWTHF